METRVGDGRRRPGRSPGPGLRRIVRPGVQLQRTCPSRSRRYRAPGFQVPIRNEPASRQWTEMGSPGIVHGSTLCTAAGVQEGQTPESLGRT